MLQLSNHVAAAPAALKRAKREKPLINPDVISTFGGELVIGLVNICVWTAKFAIGKRTQFTDWYG